MNVSSELKELFEYPTSNTYIYTHIYILKDKKIKSIKSIIQY